MLICFDSGRGGARNPEGMAGLFDRRSNCLTGTVSSSYSWPGNTMPAAFNYQLLHKEPGAYAHNFNYAAQLAIDSIEATGGSITGYVRP